MKLPRLSSASLFDGTRAKVVCLGVIGLSMIAMAWRARACESW